MESPLGKKMYEFGLRKSLISPKHSFLATFLLEERSKEKSFWDPFLKVFPKDLTNFPIFYTEEEKKLLKGTSLIKMI